MNSLVSANSESFGNPSAEDMTGLNTVVYRSLGQAWKILKHMDSPEARSLLDYCQKVGLVSLADSNTVVASYDTGKRNPPFIVIEGLDGTGKTTLTKFLQKSLDMQLLSTPPKASEVLACRPYFDSQPENIRRAFYAVGNYLAAVEVCNCAKPVVMDRFWHSTVAYAVANFQKQIPQSKIEPELLKWPEDLLKPDLVVYLEVSEEERLRRHKTRHAFTNTPEEQTLESDAAFRLKVQEIYKGISGPTFMEVNVDGRLNHTKKNLLSKVLNNFPHLSTNVESNNTL